MIKEIESGVFIISSGDSWLNGAYDSRIAANYAFRFTDAQRSRLEKEINHKGGLIGYEDLNRLKQ